MSASRERKKRQEFLASGGVDKKAVQDAQRKAAERKSTILYSVIGVLFVAVTVALLVYNSGIIERKTNAVTIDGVSYNAEDVAFYYYESLNSFYTNVVSQLGSSGLSYVGLNTSLPLSEQKAFNSTEEDAQTWDEYFKEQAVETLRFVTAATAAAKEEGFTLSAEDTAALEESIQGIKDAATVSGTSYGNYLDSMYGGYLAKGHMPKSTFESNLKDYMLATAFSSAHNESLTYTEEQVREVYNTAPASYDSVAYRLVSVDGAPEEQKDADGNTIEATDEEKAAAMSAAEETAKAILDAYNAGADLESEAKKYNNATYTKVDKGANGTLAYINWCFEEGRKAGDATMMDSDSTSTWYVVVFDRRYLDETKTVDVRHVLITKDNLTNAIPEGTSDEEIDGLVKAKAEEILASWDGTEAGFAQLARDNSQDSNAQQGGIYTGVYQGRMVETFNDWIFDSARKPGDSGIVKTDYGYHLMYYVADNLPQWYMNAEASLRTEDYTTWYDALIESVGEAAINDKGMGYVGQ